MDGKGQGWYKMKKIIKDADDKKNKKIKGKDDKKYG